jgi:hypothetical protein
VVHENGTRFVTDTAHADAAHNTAEGDDPVEGHGPSGDVKAQGFRILDRGDKIIFTGKADMLLRGARPAANADATVPAGLPADVVASAAHAEKEARPLLAAAKPTAMAPKPHPATGAKGKSTVKAAAKKI